MAKLSSQIALASVIAAAAALPAHAENFDTRLYVTPSINYLVTDPGRGEDSHEGFGLTVGLPINASTNYELSLNYAEPGNVELYNLNANLLTFFDDSNPSLFSVLSLGVLNSDGGTGDDYFSGTLSAGLGAMLPAFKGKLRLEALLRGDLHFNEDAGIGGKKAFVEPIVRIGYQIPLGPEAQVESPSGEEIAVVDTYGNDSDVDGVNDDADLCPGTPIGTTVDSTGCAISGEAVIAESDCREPMLGESVDEYGCAVDNSVVLKGVNFEFDSDVLTTEAEVLLDDVAQVIKGMEDARIEIAGHTSDEGDEFYNIDLSQRRAAAVRSYLINAGVSASQLIARGYGNKAPVQANDTVSGRRENRRVEVKLIK